MHQPTWHAKRQDIVSFKVTRKYQRTSNSGNHGGNSSNSNSSNRNVESGAIRLWCKLKHRKSFTIVSWRRSCKQTIREYPLQSAFRNAVACQIRSWKRAHGIKKKTIDESHSIATSTSRAATCVSCASCGSVGHLQADHKKPFVVLTREFLAKKINRDSIPTEFDYVGGGKGRRFRRDDDKFCRRWKHFHKTHMELQWLCVSCNRCKGAKLIFEKGDEGDKEGKTTIE